MTTPLVNNFIFDTSVLAGCSSVIRPFVNYMTDGLAVRFSPVGLEVHTLVNKEDGSVDLTPRWLYLHETKEVIDIEGDDILGAHFIIPEDGSPNKQALFFKEPDLLFLPYRI